jgi:beta-lactamase superfamily II metal-dependent hydrolase
MSNFFEIDFLEVGNTGNGDAIAVRYGQHGGTQYIHVVDGGYSEDGTKLVDHIKEHYGDPSFIDHVVLTHPDGDHAAGLKAVLEEFEVGTLWMNRPWKHLDDLMSRFDYEYTETGLRQRLRSDFPHTAQLEDMAEELGIEIRDAFQGQQIGEFTVLSPSYATYLDLIVASEKTPEPEREAAIKGNIFERAVTAFKNILVEWGHENLKGDTEGTSPENESSIVQYANLCGEKILLTGDAGVRALDEAHDFATQAGLTLPGLNRFQVPHHGSRRNLSSEVLDKWLGEKLAAQSSSTTFTAMVSANSKSKDHPKKAVVRALIHRGAKVVRTNGALCSHNNGSNRGWSTATPMDYPSDTEE